MTSRPPIGELPAQRLGNARAGGGDDDGVVRRAVRPAGAAVAAVDVDVGEAEPRQPFARELDQARMALDRVDVRREPARHRARVARAGADLEDAVAAPICAASSISATMYGCEIVCRSSIGSGVSS